MQLVFFGHKHNKIIPISLKMISFDKSILNKYLLLLGSSFGFPFFFA